MLPTSTDLAMTPGGLAAQPPLPSTSSMRQMPNLRRAELVLASWLVLVCSRSSCPSAASLATFSTRASRSLRRQPAPLVAASSTGVRRQSPSPFFQITSLRAEATREIVEESGVGEYEPTPQQQQLEQWESPSSSLSNSRSQSDAYSSQTQQQNEQEKRLQRAQTLQSSQIATPLSSAPPPPKLPELPFDLADVRRSAANCTRKLRNQVVKRLPIALRLVRDQVDGSYYGITKETYKKAAFVSDKSNGFMSRRPSVADNLSEALTELKAMRLEMEAMRREMEILKRGMISEGYLDEDMLSPGAGMGGLAITDEDKVQRQRAFDTMAADIETWAESLLAQGEEDGWKQVKCNKILRKTFNENEETQMYIKWMKDSRGKDAVRGDEDEYPCMKVSGIINAPLEDVCAYLAQEEALPDYNELVVEHRDIEILAPHCKICWSQTPQILFLKPRDFVTFCSHRWKRDGTSVIVNQAVEHPELPGTEEDSGSKACRAYALRGANFMSRCPDDPNRTRIIMVAHANPGGGVPKWATKTAINTLAPIEPFKLFHKIDENVQQNIPKVRELLAQTDLTTAPGGRSKRPAGIAQMGYACFWPQGGGRVEGMVDVDEAHEKGD